MKGKAKGILLAAVLAAVLIAALLGYRLLSERAAKTAESSGSSAVAGTDGSSSNAADPAGSAAGIEDEAGSKEETAGQEETVPFEQPGGEGTEEQADTPSSVQSGGEEAGTGAGDGEASENTGDLQEAPDFVAEDAEGNEVWLSDFRGSLTVVNFWASWCPPCQSEMPHFEEAFQEYGDRVQFLMLDLTDGSRETRETAEKYIAGQGYTFPVYYDTMMSGAVNYAVYSIPRTVVVSPEGYVVGEQIGAMDRETLYGLFTPYLEEQE